LHSCLHTTSTSAADVNVVNLEIGKIVQRAKKGDRKKMRESKDVELFKLSENQCKKIADMMIRNRNPEEKELILNKVLKKPMYLESPLKGWRGLSKGEKAEFLKKQEPLTLSVFQEGKVIFHIKLKDGIKGFLELTVETIEDEEKKG
jgi:hypothetical protein